MAIVTDGVSSNSAYQAASGSYNWSHTVVSSNNTILVVSVALLSVSNSVTALTYNSISLTKLRSDISVSGTVRTEIWYLLSPPKGANSIAVTLNTASVSIGMGASFSGVSQYSPIDGQNGTTGVTGAGGGSASVSTTIVTEGAWLIDTIATSDSDGINATGPNQTELSNVTGAVGSGGQSYKTSNDGIGPLTPGSVSMQWDNIAALTSWTMSTFAMLPATTRGTTTSTSSTSTSSTSVSSTSSSTSSTSSSTSSTSSSTSSTSTSISTSSTSISTTSTSSSISSTSTSISSTSTSSTSISTTISSTSSSISSTSVSSTSTSSTSSSTSRSSTSTSFSSTSSSISSTSNSTSSTSNSTSSTSSSTSSTTLPPPYITYSYQDKLTVPTDASNLVNAFSNAQYSDVAGDDEDYFIEYGSEYMVREYKRRNTNNTDNIQFTWRGRSTEPSTASPILIQIYNVNSASWETLANANTIPADKDFSVTVNQTANLSNYYDASNIVTFRSYQQVI